MRANRSERSTFRICPLFPESGGDTMQFYGGDLRGKKKIDFSFNLDFSLFLINLPDCPFWVMGGAKGLAKGFRFKMAWNLPSQILTGQKINSVKGWVGRFLSHMPINPLDLNAQYTQLATEVSNFSEQMSPRLALFELLNWEIDSKENSVRSCRNKGYNK